MEPLGCGELRVSGHEYFMKGHFAPFICTRSDCIVPLLSVTHSGVRLTDDSKVSTGVNVSVNNSVFLC